ncbi:MAG TPA: hypothetical protein VE913_08690 [Longimicrobium sp.]|nr:hypothetical protein [Longimicrobium sp.]
MLGVFGRTASSGGAGSIRGWPAERDLSIVCERLAVPGLHGLNDLDYFEMVVFNDPRGRQIFLDWHMRARVPGAVLYLESEVGADDTLTGLLTLLPLDRTAVPWRPESPAPPPPDEPRTVAAP